MYVPVWWEAHCTCDHDTWLIRLGLDYACVRVHVHVYVLVLFPTPSLPPPTLYFLPFFLHPHLSISPPHTHITLTHSLTPGGLTVFHQKGLILDQSMSSSILTYRSVIPPLSEWLYIMWSHFMSLCVLDINVFSFPTSVRHLSVSTTLTHKSPTARSHTHILIHSFAHVHTYMYSHTSPPPTGCDDVHWWDELLLCIQDLVLLQGLSKAGHLRLWSAKIHPLRVGNSCPVWPLWYLNNVPSPHMDLCSQLSDVTW